MHADELINYSTSRIVIVAVFYGLLILMVDIKLWCTRCVLCFIVLGIYKYYCFGFLLSIIIEMIEVKDQMLCYHQRNFNEKVMLVSPMCVSGKVCRSFNCFNCFSWHHVTET